MTVFLVEYCVNYEGSHVVGVFSTSEKAEEYMERNPLGPKDEWWSMTEMTLDETSD